MTKNSKKRSFLKNNMFSFAVLILGIGAFTYGLHINETQEGRIKQIDSKLERTEDRLLEKDKIIFIHEEKISDLKSDILKYKKDVDIKDKKINSLIKRTSTLEKKIEKYRSSANIISLRSNNRPNSPQTSPSKKKISVVATAYTSKCRGCSGITKTGLNIKNSRYHKKIIAVDPRVIKLHSTVKVDVGGESFIAKAEDIGGAIKGNKIDVLVNKHSQAISFGKQKATVTVLKSGK